MTTAVDLKSLLSVFVLLLAFEPHTFAGNLVWSYGFEIGDCAEADPVDCPGYPFSGGIEEESATCNVPACTTHRAMTQVVGSYDGDSARGETNWLPHSGDYFFLRADRTIAPYLDVPVPGITYGCVQDNMHLGDPQDKCGDNTFDVSDITTGELFFSFWARQSGQQRGATNPCKWFRAYGNGSKTDIIGHIYWEEEPVDKWYTYLYVGHDYVDSGETSVPIFDGNWHKFSYYLNFNTGVFKLWLDATDENVDTPDRSASSIDFETTTGVAWHKIQANYSNTSPDQGAYHAVDDIEVWDGMPDQGDSTPPSAPTGLRILGLQKGVGS